MNNFNPNLFPPNHFRRFELNSKPLVPTEKTEEPVSEEVKQNETPKPNPEQPKTDSGLPQDVINLEDIPTHLLYDGPSLLPPPVPPLTDVSDEETPLSPESGQDDPPVVEENGDDTGNGTTIYSDGVTTTTVTPEGSVKTESHTTDSFSTTGNSQNSSSTDSYNLGAQVYSNTRTVTENGENFRQEEVFYKNGRVVTTYYEDGSIRSQFTYDNNKNVLDGYVKDKNGDYLFDSKGIGNRDSSKTDDDTKTNGETVGKTTQTVQTNDGSSTPNTQSDTDVDNQGYTQEELQELYDGIMNNPLLSDEEKEQALKDTGLDFSSVNKKDTQTEGTEDIANKLSNEDDWKNVEVHSGVAEPEKDKLPDGVPQGAIQGDDGIYVLSQQNQETGRSDITEYKYNEETGKYEVSAKYSEETTFNMETGLKITTRYDENGNLIQTTTTDLTTGKETVEVNTNNNETVNRDNNSKPDGIQIPDAFKDTEELYTDEEKEQINDFMNKTQADSNNIEIKRDENGRLVFKEKTENGYIQTQYDPDGTVHIVEYEVKDGKEVLISRRDEYMDGTIYVTKDGVTTKISSDEKEVNTDNRPEWEKNGFNSEEDYNNAVEKGLDHSADEYYAMKSQDAANNENGHVVERNNGKEKLYYGPNGNLEKVEVTRPDGSVITTYADGHQEISETFQDTGITVKYEYKDGQKILISATDKNGNDKTDYVVEKFNQQNNAANILDALNSGAYGTGANFDKNRFISDMINKAGYEMVNLNNLNTESVYNILKQYQGMSFNDIVKVLTEANNKAGRKSNNNNGYTNYNQPGGQSFGFGDQGYNDVFGNTSWNSGYHLDFHGNWVSNGSGGSSNSSYNNWGHGGGGGNSGAHY